MRQLSVDSLYELQILSHKPDGKSILSLFNKAHTYQGKEKLKDLLSFPLDSIEQIKQRQQIIQFVSEHLTQLTIDVAQGYLTAAQNHLVSSLAWSSNSSLIRRYWRTQWLRWFRPHDYYQLQSGVAAVQLVLQTIKQRTNWWTSQIQLPGEMSFFAQKLQSSFAPILDGLTKPLNQAKLLQVDYLLRYQHVDQVKSILDIFYQLDAYCGVARFLKTVDWTYPVFVNEAEPTFKATSLSHPLISQELAVSNSFQFTEHNKLTLLTGGNMSGKTTFLKTCGLAVYLAHTGFPVPASSVHLSFFDCLLTSIHLSDNLELGYSHFYTELIRVKEVAKAISMRQHIFLIADEIFRGTNPQDALLCARQVIDKLLNQVGNLYMISSHLPELGTYYESNKYVQFNCFKTGVLDSKLFFTYKLEPGVVIEKTGLLLLEQTGILSILS